MAFDKHAYYMANRARIRAQVKARYDAKRDEIIEKSKAYRERNREPDAAKHRVYYQRNKERILARVKARANAKAVEVAAYKKGWHARNREAIVAKKRASYALNRDEVRIKQKAIYDANPGPFKTRSKLYRQANPDKVKATVAKWCNENRAHLRAVKNAWSLADRRAHPERYAEMTSRRKAQKLKTQVERINFKKILTDANGVCGICHQPFDLFGIDFDHIVPLARGGSHTTDNIQATHSRCNRAKGAKVG